MDNKTLWSLLKEQRIEIPIIQRDYVQGRIGKEHLRERFLGQLIGSLRNNTQQTLDFVYGTNEHGAIWPLDGQQRLTTLWLLHWYLAVRTGNLQKEKDVLGRFTYETRVSSRDFCHNLCNLFDADDFNTQSELKIAEYIKNQTWFFGKYEQDPTVQGMLRTLGGTDILNSEDIDITDGIEEYLCDDQRCDEYWALLTSNACPIHFLFKDMKDENLPLSDDLYIKMNARGKQLSDFENFKADFVGYAPNPDKPSQKLMTVEEAALIDNEWTDLFWQTSADKGIFCVDDVFFKFLRRYFLCRHIAMSGKSVEDMLKDELYMTLYKGKTKEYTGIKPYAPVVTRETIDALKAFFANWRGYNVCPHWQESEPFYFIPEYIDSDNVTNITLKQRPLFYAVCCYVEECGTFHQDKYDAWMRFVWNIVENGNVTSEDGMIGAVRLIHELRSHCTDIIPFLASDAKIESKFAARQMAEERFKARLRNGEKASVWNPLLDAAENHAFFKGNIACLLRADQEEMVDDAEMFATKYEHAVALFDDDRVREDKKIEVMKALIKSVDKWSLLCDREIFNTSADSWKQKLLNSAPDRCGNSYHSAVHKLFMADVLDEIEFVNIEDGNVLWAESVTNAKRIIVDTDMITSFGEIVTTTSRWRFRWAYESLCFFKYNSNYAYCFDWKLDNGATFQRNELLHHPDIHVYNEEHGGVFWKWNILFSYNGYNYMWNNHNDVFMLDENYSRVNRDSEHKNESNDETFVLHLRNHPNLTHVELFALLNGLTEEYSHQIASSNSGKPHGTKRNPYSSYR